MKEYIKRLGRVIYSTQGHDHIGKHQLNLLHINDAAQILSNFTTGLLQWIEEQGFVLYKDGRWYSPKHFKGRPSTYYTHKQLIELYEKAICST